MKVNLTFKNLSLSGELVRLARLAAVRFALQTAGALLCASAPLVLRAGETLQSLGGAPEPSQPPQSFQPSRPAPPDPPFYRDDAEASSWFER